MRYVGRMTTLQKLQLLASTQRARLNTISGLDELSDEVRSESETLATAYSDTEIQIRAAIIAEGDEAEQRSTDTGDVTVTAEMRERLELRSKSTLANYIRAAINSRSVDGAESELSAAHGCPGAVPFAMFETVGEGVEHRDVTPGPSTADTTVPRSIVPALFAGSLAQYFGVDMPEVDAGDQGFPVLGTSVTAGPKAKGAAAAQTAGAFTVTTAQPRRVTGSVKFRREDAARLDGMEMSLQQNLRAVIVDGVNNQLLNGSGSGDGTLAGLFSLLDDPSAPAAGVATYGKFNSELLSAIDGVNASERTDVRAVFGLDTYRLAGASFRANNSNDSALDLIERGFGGVRASSKVPAKSSHVQQAIARLENPAGDRVAAMPTWGGLEIIRDVYGTNAAQGEIVLTALVLVGDVVLTRKAAFKELAFRVSV